MTNKLENGSIANRETAEAKINGQNSDCEQTSEKISETWTWDQLKDWARTMKNRSEKICASNAKLACLFDDDLIEALGDDSTNTDEQNSELYKSWIYSEVNYAARRLRYADKTRQKIQNILNKLTLLDPNREVFVFSTKEIYDQSWDDVVRLKAGEAIDVIRDYYQELLSGKDVPAQCLITRIDENVDELNAEAKTYADGLLAKIETYADDQEIFVVPRFDSYSPYVMTAGQLRESLQGLDYASWYGRKNDDIEVLGKYPEAENDLKARAKEYADSVLEMIASYPDEQELTVSPSQAYTPYVITAGELRKEYQAYGPQEHLENRDLHGKPTILCDRAASEDELWEDDGKLKQLFSEKLHADLIDRITALETSGHEQVRIVEENADKETVWTVDLAKQYIKNLRLEDVHCVRIESAK